MPDAVPARCATARRYGAKVGPRKLRPMDGTSTAPGVRRQAGGDLPVGARPSVSLPAVMALTACFAIVGFVLVLTAIEAATTPVPLGPPFPISENQRAESLTYALTAVVVVPLAMLAAGRVLRALSGRVRLAELESLAPLAAGTLALGLLAVRLGPEGKHAASAVSVAWVAVWALLALACASGRGERLASARPLAPSWTWAAAAVSSLALLVGFCDPSSLSVPALLVGAALAILVVRRTAAGTRLPEPSRRAGLAIDVLAVVLLLLAVPDLVIFRNGPSVPPIGYSFGLSSIVNYHHDLWLGPTNEVLAGRPLLVDTASQYGIGPIYLLAAWFHLAPIGYGTLGFLDGVAFALMMCSAYAVLRLAGVGRLMAWAAMAVAVVVLIYNLVYPIGAIPQHGPLRFGLPMLVVLGATLEARGGRTSRMMRFVQPAVVGLAAIWSIEALAYTAVTFGGVVAIQAALEPRGGRWSLIWPRALAAAVAAAVAILALSGLTLIFTGSFPDFGLYLTYFHSFLFGPISKFTYDFGTWAAGLAVGAAYLLSASAFAWLLIRRADLVRARLPAFMALGSCNAFGIALFTYFVDRSLDHVLPYVSLPLLLVVTLWVALLSSGALDAPRRARLGGLSMGLAVGVLVTAVAFSSIAVRFPRSALGKLVPGGESLTTAVHALWHPPPLSAAAPVGERLLDAYMPGQDRVLILLSPNLANEILLRSGRSNELPFTDPVEDSYIGHPTDATLVAAVDRLRPGQRLLMQDIGLHVARVARREPDRDLSTDPAVPVTLLVPAQQEAVALIARRFDLRVLRRQSGFVVLELESR